MIRKYDGGLMALTTPWGLEKSPEATQINHFTYGFPLLFGWAFGGIIVCQYITAIFEPGFGLAR